MKTPVLFGLLALALQATGAEFVRDGSEYVYRDTVRFEESAEGISNLDCEVVNGTLNLSGEMRSTVVVVAYVEIRAEELEEGQKYLKDFRPTVERKGSKIKVSGEYPEDNWTWNDMSASMDFVVTAPKSLSLDASCANGTITSVEMQGDADLETANGEINFLSRDGVTGRLNASCANGEIEVNVASVHGDCDFSAANGEISVTVSKQLDGDISASTANGEIEILVPDDASINISASSLVNGSIDTDWGGTDDDGIFDNSFQLVVNEGSHKVDCTTVNGQISVRKYSSAAH